MPDAFQSINNEFSCSNCQKDNEPGSTFCAHCGTKLSPEKRAAPTRDLESLDPIAKSLAPWDLDPPHIVVRRKTKR